MSDREKVIKGLEQFKADFKPFCGNGSDWARVDDALVLLKEQEAKKGEWMFDRPGHWKCSECGYMEGRIVLTEYRNYCPVCGAKMKEQ